MFEKIKKWYKLGLWTEVMINNTFAKGVITEEQTIEILNSQKKRNNNL